MRKDLKELEKTFKSMKNDKGVLGLILIDKATFLSKTLDKLEEVLEKEEMVVEMQQGAYSINRSNPALASYNASIKNYQSLIKQINELLPTQVSAEDEFDEFNK